MKKLLNVLLVFLFGNIAGLGAAIAADPGKIQVGILLPLTGTFAACRSRVLDRIVARFAERQFARGDIGLGDGLLLQKLLDGKARRTDFR